MHTVTEHELEADVEATTELARTAQEVRDRCRQLLAHIDEAEQGIEFLRQGGAPSVEQLEEAEIKLDELWHEVYALAACAMGWRYSENDVARWCQRAVDMGCPHPKIDASRISDLLYERQVPVEPLRLQFESLMTGDDPEEKDTEHITRTIARELGIHRKEVPRILGHRAISGKRSLRIFVDYDKAVTLARVLGLSPHEAGI